MLIRAGSRSTCPLKKQSGRQAGGRADGAGGAATGMGGPGDECVLLSDCQQPALLAAQSWEGSVWRKPLPGQRMAWN